MEWALIGPIPVGDAGGPDRFCELQIGLERLPLWCRSATRHKIPFRTIGPIRKSGGRRVTPPTQITDGLQPVVH